MPDIVCTIDYMKYQDYSDNWSTTPKFMFSANYIGARERLQKDEGLYFLLQDFILLNHSAYSKTPNKHFSTLTLTKEAFDGKFV